MYLLPLLNLSLEQTFRLSHRCGTYKICNRDKFIKGVHRSNYDQAVYDIHNMLNAYYKVANKLFTNNFVIQITERHICIRC